MKKKCILIILLSLYTNSYLFAQSYVCNLKGNRVELSCDSTKKIMVISGSMDSSDISRILMETNSAIGEKNIEILSSHLISVHATEPQVRELYLSLQGDTNYISISDVLRTRNGFQIWCTNKILVKTENLDSLASILEKGGYMLVSSFTPHTVAGLSCKFTGKNLIPRAAASKHTFKLSS